MTKLNREDLPLLQKRFDATLSLMLHLKRYRDEIARFYEAWREDWRSPRQRNLNNAAALLDIEYNNSDIARKVRQDEIGSFEMSVIAYGLRTLDDTIDTILFDDLDAAVSVLDDACSRLGGQIDKIKECGEADL